MTTTTNEVIKPIIEEEIYFTDKEFFGDKEEYAYDCECYDGYAIGHLCEDLYGIDYDNKIPKEIRIEYPTLAKVLRSDKKIREVLNYRGLFDCTEKDITFGDIMVIYGEIKKK